MSNPITPGDEHLEGNIGKLMSSGEPRLAMPESSKARVLSTLLRGAAAAQPVAETQATPDLTTNTQARRQAAVRLVPDVPTDLADGAQRGDHPIAQLPGQRHVRRRFVAMSQRKTVRWLAERPVRALTGLAACLTLIVTLWVVAGGGNAQEAFAAAIAGAQKARTFSCKEVLQSRRNGQVYERSIIFKEPYRERSEWLSGVASVGDVTITDYGQRRRLRFFPANKLAELDDISSEYEVKTGSGELKLTELDTSIRDRMLALRAEAVEDLGNVELAGQSVRLLQSRQGDRVTKVWVHPQTGLPVQIAVDRPEWLRMYTSIQIDAEVDDALLSLEPPAGYTLIGDGPRKRVSDDKAKIIAKMRHLLVACCSYANSHNNQYPKELSDLQSEGITPETLKSILAAPDQPDGPPVLRYRQPPVGATPTKAVLLYQAFDQWPQGGIWVGFGDAHCELITKQEKFEALTR